MTIEPPEDYFKNLTIATQPNTVIGNVSNVTTNDGVNVMLDNTYSSQALKDFIDKVVAQGKLTGLTTPADKTFDDGRVDKKTSKQIVDMLMEMSGYFMLEGTMHSFGGTTYSYEKIEQVGTIKNQDGTYCVTLNNKTFRPRMVGSYYFFTIRDVEKKCRENHDAYLKHQADKYKEENLKNSKILTLEALKDL
jgi:hypothetical protein